MNYRTNTMTINTQSRSQVQSKSTLVPSISHTQSDHTRRSVSLSDTSSLLGSSDASTFFSVEKNPNLPKSADQSRDLEDSLEDSLEDAAQAPLDIVGALHTLNLDADLDESSIGGSNNDNPERKRDVLMQATAMDSAVVEKDRDLASSVPPPPPQPQVLLSQNILTPNPSSAATFGAGSSTTPSYAGWGTSFLPFSASPMRYAASNSSIAAEMAFHIPPFHLPEEKSGENLPIGLETPKPQPVHSNFGAILDSRFAFENFGSGGGAPSGGFSPSSYTQEMSKNNDGTDLFVENGATPACTNTPFQHYAGLSLWNEHLHHPAPQFMVKENGDSKYMDNKFGHFGHMNVNTNVNIIPASPGLASPNFREESNDFGGPRLARMDGSQQQHPTSQNHTNRRHEHQHFNNNSRRLNHMSGGGVNFHRKMHYSHKRKGDDASKYANAKLEDFSSEIFSLCRDQHGCRFLQQQLDAGSDVTATMVFNELYLKIVELMVDPFGNYLIQKLFESVSADQLLILVKNAAPDLVRVALDPHGTRALQKLVECISTPEESRLIIASLAPHVVALSRDLNGNHVVQKCLQRLDPEENQFIFDTASEHCVQIATHRHGCCVLQRCLDHGSLEQKAQLSMKVAQNSTHLSSDPFGNYVVQYVLTRGDEKSVAKILDHILAQILSLSLHKFGSNVIEKSLRINRLTDAVINMLLKNQSQFSVLLNDPFGNYVLQTSLDVASARDLAMLAESLQPFLPNIKNTPHGRRILTKIQNIL